MANPATFQIDSAAPYKSYQKGKLINNGVTTVGAGASVDADLDTSGYSWATLFFRLGNVTTPATAAGDIGGFAVAYEDDGVTLYPNGLVGGVSAFANDASATIRAATLNTPYATLVLRINLAGIDKLRIRLLNNNVAALQGATVIYFLQR